MIYFISAEYDETYPIKIGFTAMDDPWVRLSAVQVGNPHKLMILAVSGGDGDLDEELNLHHKFAADRLEGEWFQRSDELMAEIARLSVDIPDRPESLYKARTSIAQKRKAATLKFGELAKQQLGINPMGLPGVIELRSQPQPWRRL
jgi:hypothetical protein